MSELENHIKRVNNKLQQVLKQFQLLQKDNERLRNELKEKKEKQELQLQQIDALQQQVSILRSAAGKMEEGDKKEFEKRIGQYIKEIDKCIGLLSE